MRKYLGPALACTLFAFTALAADDVASAVVGTVKAVDKATKASSNTRRSRIAVRVPYRIGVGTDRAAGCFKSAALVPRIRDS